MPVNLRTLELRARAASLLCRLLHTAVQHVGNVIHVATRPACARWIAVNPKAASNAGISASFTPPAPAMQRRPSSATFSAASRAKIRLMAASAVASKRSLAFSFSLPSAASAARRASVAAHSA